MKKQNDTFYELLKVQRTANVAEIVAAYHTARSAFSKDSVATYSLFSAEEIQIELTQLEEAYLTLSNIDKKREYDRRLTLKGPELAKQPAALNPLRQAGGAAPKQDEPVEASPPPEPPRTDDMSGSFLKQMRMHWGLSLDDVARITKIPAKFIRSIEAEDIKTLPARVYVQGFIKNLATLYKLDPKTTASSYLNSIDSRTKEIWKE